MKNHKKQIAAAVIITIIFVLLFAGYALLYFALDELPLLLRILLGGLMTGFAVAMLFILRDRIKEIRKGENDDLGNY